MADNDLVLPFVIDIRDRQIDIKTDCVIVPWDGTSGGIQGGVACTGVIDVEKVIKKIEPPGGNGVRPVRVWILEKKLPFQVLILRLPDQAVPPEFCIIFHPRSQGFFGNNFRNLSAADQCLAINCTAAPTHSVYLAELFTATVNGTPGCALPCTPPVDADCLDRIEDIFTPSGPPGSITTDDVIAAACLLASPGDVPNVIRQLTIQYLANWFNVCLCVVGGPQGDVGGVRLDCVFDLNQLPEPTRSDAIAIFGGNATPTVQQVLAEAESILNLFCTPPHTVSPDANTIQEVLAAGAQDPPTTIIVC